MERRTFIERLAGASAVASASPALTPLLRAVGPAPADNFPKQPLDLVRAVVAAAHSDLAKVRELVTAQQALAKCAWDFGFGDWESPLDAASHVGRPEIATFLLANGARPTIFSAAMLGELDVVRAFITASPGIQRTHGPHGITLLAHARAGGPPARAVVDYLTELGDADIASATIPIEEPLAAFVGSYAYGADPADRLAVTENQGRLRLARGGDSSYRPLFCKAPRRFFPGGAPAVEIGFTAAGSTMATLTIVDGPLTLVATRV